MARHRVPRTRLRRVACLVLLVAAVLVIWGAAGVAAKRCEAYSGRVIVDRQSVVLTACEIQ